MQLSSNSKTPISFPAAVTYAFNSTGTTPLQKTGSAQVADLHGLESFAGIFIALKL